MSTESKRVRTARALDEIEAKARECGQIVRDSLHETTHYMNRMMFDSAAFVRETAERHEIEWEEIAPDALAMLREELVHCLDGERVLERKVEPYMSSSKCIGMKITFYKDLWEKARTA